MATTEERVAAAQAAHPGKRVVAIETAGGLVVCVQPTRAQVILYQSMLWQTDDAGRRATAYEELLRMCCVDPDHLQLKALIEEWPGIGFDADVIETLKQLAGVTKKK